MVPLVIVALGPEVLVHNLLLTVPGAVSALEVPVGAEELVGRVMALSGPALAVGGMLAQVPLPEFQVEPAVQLVVTVAVSSSCALL